VIHVHTVIRNGASSLP